MKEEMQTSIHHVRGSVILLTLRVFGVLFFVDTAFALVIALGIFFGIDTAYYNLFVIFLWLLHTVKFFIELYLVLSFVLPWATTTYYIADHQLIQCGGIVNVDQKIYELTKLREVDEAESWLGKLFNYGTIHGTVSVSGFSDQFVMPGIADAKKYERILRDYLIEANKV